MKILLLFLSILAAVVFLMKLVQWIFIVIGAGKHMDDEETKNPY